MKALEVVEETDPQGTVVGVLGVVNLPRGRIPPTLRYLILAATAFILALALLHASVQVLWSCRSSRSRAIAPARGFIHSNLPETSLMCPFCRATAPPHWHINASAMEAWP